jgi:hypothetical protein
MVDRGLFLTLLRTGEKRDLLDARDAVRQTIPIASGDTKAHVGLAVMKAIGAHARRGVAASASSSLALIVFRDSMQQF